MTVLLEQKFGAVYPEGEELLAEWLGGVLQWQNRRYPWRPPTDVLETETALLVRLEVAGMKPEDFSVRFQDQVLVIRGVRRDPFRQACAYHRMEIRFGRFEVLLRVHRPVDPEGIEAVYQDGFLVVTLPKVAPKSVSVKP